MTFRPSIAADLVAPSDQLDFFHAAGIDLPRPLTALEAWNGVRRQRVPGLAFALRIRNAVSARFGVGPLGGFGPGDANPPRVGDKLDFFTVERLEPETLTLAQRDRHLDVLTCVTTHDQRLMITSSVRVHNLYGRIYMIPVGVAHRLIVSMILRRLKRRLAAG